MVAVTSSLYALALIGILWDILQALTPRMGHGRRLVMLPPDWHLFFILSLVLILFVLFFQIKIPFSSLRPVFRARTKADTPPFDPSQVISLQVCFSNFSLFLIIFPLASYFHIFHFNFFVAANVQQVWIWWETQSNFRGRFISASIFKHKSIHKWANHSQVSISSLVFDICSTVIHATEARNMQPSQL